MDVHQRLRRILEERGWTEYKLAKNSGLSESTISNIFKRNTIPSLTTLEAICNGLGITLSQFLIKTLELHKRSGSKLEMIAETINPIVRGWMNYFGAFNRSAMKGTLDVIQRRLVKWAMCKYKRFRGHRTRAEEWLRGVKRREPKMFAHWALSRENVL